MQKQSICDCLCCNEREICSASFRFDQIILYKIYLFDIGQNLVHVRKEIFFVWNKISRRKKKKPERTKEKKLYGLFIVRRGYIRRVIWRACAAVRCGILEVIGVVVVVVVFDWCHVDVSFLYLSPQKLCTKWKRSFLLLLLPKTRMRSEGGCNELILMAWSFLEVLFLSFSMNYVLRAFIENINNN